MRRLFLWLLVLLNAVVLLGQLWPEGRPPFARAVDIVFLVLALGFFLHAATRGASREPSTNPAPEPR